MKLEVRKVINCQQEPFSFACLRRGISACRMNDQCFQEGLTTLLFRTGQTQDRYSALHSLA